MITATIRGSISLLRPLTRTPIALFSDKTWKERDEAAEKVFISRQEST